MIFERLPVHSGEYSHNLTANFCGGTERTPPHPTQRVNVSVCILEGTMFPCITDSVLFLFISFITVLEILAVGAVAWWLAHELAPAVY